MKLFLILFAATLLSISCGSQKTAGKEKKDFYPIAGYFQSQLNHLDSMPLAVIHYRTIDNAVDTFIVDKADFRKAIVSKFIESDISTPDKIQQYEETPLLDASVGTMTLIYTPEQGNTLPVRKLDVLLSATNSDVFTIYIEKVLPAKDSTVIEKMLWTNNKNCQITTLIQQPGAEEKVIHDKYIWDK